MDFVATVRQAQFTKLWLAQVISQIAQNLLNFALIIEVFNLAAHTHFANISVGLVVLAFGVPSIFFSAAAGAYVDHWNRKRVLVVTNLLRTILVLGYVRLDHNLGAILLLTFVVSSVNQFFVPAEAATIPKLVSSKLLMTANALFIFSLYTSFIVGYSLAGPVIASLGNRGPFYLASLAFAMATLLVLWLPAGTSPSEKKGGKLARPRLRSVLQDNWHIIRSQRWTGFSILQLTITQTVVGISLALAPALSLALLHQPLQKSSWYLIFPAGVGMVAGIGLVTLISKRIDRVRILERSLILAGASFALLGLTGELYHMRPGHHFVVPTAQIAIIVAILVFSLGLLNAIISATAQTLLQESSDDATRGKVFGSLNMFINIAATVPVFVAGALADLLSVTRVVTIIGILVMVYGIFQLIHIHKRKS